MWYCKEYKVGTYSLGYAISSDGLNWRRLDKKVGLNKTGTTWVEIGTLGGGRVKRKTRKRRSVKRKKRTKRRSTKRKKKTIKKRKKKRRRRTKRKNLKYN